MTKRNTKVTLRPINKGNRPIVPNKVTVNGKTGRITQNGEIISDKQAKEEGTLLLNLNFATTNGKPITFNKADSSDKKIVESLKHHQLVSVPGPNGEEMNPNCIGRPAVELIDHEQKTINQSIDRKTRATIMNIVNNLDEPSLINLAYMMGLDAKELDYNEIYLEVNDTAVEMGNSFFNMFTDDSSTYRIIANKALYYNVLNVERGQVKYGSDIIGAEGDEDIIDKIVSYFRQNDKQFRHIRSQVAQNDVDFHEIDKDSVDFINEETRKTIEKVLNKGEDKEEKEEATEEKSEKTQGKKGGRRANKQKEAAEA